jgi:site-specific DNA-adenine methylase
LNENKLDKNICEYFIIASYNVRGIAQNIQSIERLQELNIGGLLLSNLSYDEVPIENDSVIYCDPPYINTGTYLDDFNHEKFYEWLRECREKNQQVFISEYQMPDDFFEVYFKDKTCTFNGQKVSKKLEKLFSTLKYSPIELFEW